MTRAWAKPGFRATAFSNGPRAAADLARIPEEANARVLRQDLVDRAVGEHDELVDSFGERPELRLGCGERGVGRIDLLGDEDQLAHQK